MNMDVLGLLDLLCLSFAVHYSRTSVEESQYSDKRTVLASFPRSMQASPEATITKMRLSGTTNPAVESDRAHGPRHRYRGGKLH